MMYKSLSAPKQVGMYRDKRSWRKIKMVFMIMIVSFLKLSASSHLLYKSIPDRMSFQLILEGKVVDSHGYPSGKSKFENN